MLNDRVYEQLYSLNMSHKRCSQDKVSNRLGRRLVEFCKANDLVILNGRAFSDAFGKFSCKNTSVIDYTLATVDA